MDIGGEVMADASGNEAAPGVTVQTVEAFLFGVLGLTVDDAVARSFAKAPLKLNGGKPFIEAPRYLAEREVGSPLLCLEVQQDLVEHEQDLGVQKARLAAAEASLASLQEPRRRAEIDYLRTNLSDLAQREQKAQSLAEELVKAQEHRALQTLTASRRH